MTCPKPLTHPETYVPVCASVICEAPGVIYVSIDPDVWKIRCRQCQEKTEHKCALKKLKNKFRGDPSKRRKPKETALNDGAGMGLVGTGLMGTGLGAGAGAGGGMGQKGFDEESLDLNPPEPIPDDVCACADRPKNAPMKPNVCLCEIYKPLNFMFELEVTGEYIPAYAPKTKKGKTQSNV